MTAPKLTTLKRRSEFLRTRGGSRCAMPCFVVEAKPRPPAEDGMSCSSPVPSSTNTARFGFTVTKQLGKAVVRNKIRRRLKEAVRAIAPANTLPDLDYVIIARQPSLDRPFERLKQDLADALVKVNRTPAAKSSYRPHKARIEAKPAATPPQRGNSESASNPAHGLIKDGLVQGQTVRERKGAKEPS